MTDKAAAYPGAHYTYDSRRQKATGNRSGNDAFRDVGTSRSDYKEQNECHDTHKNYLLYSVIAEEMKGTQPILFPKPKKFR